MLLACTAIAAAQDLLSVASPDGRLTFRVFIGQPEPGALSRLAYQVLLQDRPIVKTSYIGLDFLNQEPLLGENDGLIGVKSGRGAGYNSLIAEYMQNGSIGRRINIEARAYNAGVAFRYILPPQTPLQPLLLTNDATEFRFTQPVKGSNEFALPLLIPQPGEGWLAVTEVTPPGYPAAMLARLDYDALVTRLSHSKDDPEIAYQGKTPLACPWRVILLGPDKDRLLQSPILRVLAAN